MLYSLCAAFAVLLCLAGFSEAAGIKVIPSSTRVSPGETFYIDIMAENIPAEGLGAIQFRLNVDAPGSVVKGVTDISQAELNAVSVAAPLIIGQPTSTRSGIGRFFLDAAGPHGILVMDNESLLNGSGLYTFGHTNGSTPQGGSGIVARFQFAVGKNAAAEKINITLSEVMLLDSGTEYTLESNAVAAIELRCNANVPNLLGLSQNDAQNALQAAGLLTGNIYEINNPNGTYALNKVLEQSVAAGTSALCETQVDLAINTAPPEVGNPAAMDKTGDENGAVMISWNASSSTDTAGYRIYLVTGPDSLLKEIGNPSSSKTEISGLPSGQSSQIKITAFDTFGNESGGVIISTTAVDDVYPGIEISGVVEGAYYKDNILPTINATDANLSSLEITLNGSPYNLLPISLDGNYTLRVVARDASGNNTTKEVHFTVDKTAPVLTVSTLSDGSWTNNDLLNVSGMVTDYIAIRQLTVNGAVVATNPDLSFSHPVVLQDGENTIAVRAVDFAGNETTDTRKVYLDRNAPEIVIITPADNIKTRLSPIELTGAVDEQSTVSVKVNGPDPLPALMDGNNFSLAIEPAYDINTIEVTATDLAGNTSTLKRTVTFDDLSPSLSVTGPAQDVKTNKADMTIMGETADLTAVSIKLTMDGNIYTPGITDGRFEQPVSFTAEKNYQIYVTAVDEAGNETLVQRNIVYDITAPAVTIDLVTSPTNSNSQVLTGTMEAGTVVTVTCPDATVGIVAYPSSTTWTAEISNMQEDINTIAVTATDDAGNTSSAIFADIMADMTPPVTTITTGGPKHSDGTLFVTGNTPFILTASDNLSGVSITEYRIDDGIWTSYTPFNIVPEGLHTIYYRSIDEAGNLEDTKTLTVILDKTAPVSGINVGTPQYQAGDKLYIGGNTLIAILSADAGSGVGRTEYSVDGSAYILYAGPFTLSAYSGSQHVIAYRSIDNVMNAETEKTFSIIVDSTPPLTVLSASDPLTDGVINTVSPGTRFLLASTDNGTGIKEIQYRINNGDWSTYLAGFPLPGVAGTHTLGFRAIDNVGNEEAEKTLTANMIVIDVTKEIYLGPVVLAGAWRQYKDREGHDNERPAEVTINALADILLSSGMRYYIPQSEDEFKETFRSGRYDTYVLVDFKKEGLTDELKEAVNYGDGLVYIKTTPDTIPSLADVFGVKFSGMSTNKDMSVDLTESPINGASTLQSRGKAVKTTIISPAAVGLGYVTDKKDTHPVIVSNEYGRGKAVLFAFDLLNSPEQTKVKELLISSINYVMPSEYYTRAMSDVPITINIQNSTEPVDIQVTETLPDNMTADSITPPATQSGNTITWQFTVGAGGRSPLDYWLNLPDTAGDYQLGTEVKYNNQDSYRPYGNYNLTLNVFSSSSGLLEDIIADLEGLTVSVKDRKHIEEAIEELGEIKADASTREKAEENIRRVTETIEELREVKTDVSAIRLKLDELLKIWQKKWSLLPEEKKHDEEKDNDDHQDRDSQDRDGHDRDGRDRDGRDGRDRHSWLERYKLVYETDAKKMAV